MVLDVAEYHANVYYNAKTGERVHAAFHFQTGLSML